MFVWERSVEKHHRKAASGGFAGLRPLAKSRGYNSTHPSHKKALAKASAFLNDVFRCAEHITSLCGEAAIHRCANGATSLVRTGFAGADKHRFTYVDEQTYKTLNEQCTSIRVMLIASCKTAKSHASE